RPDLAAANGFSDDIAVLLGNGDGTFRTQVRSGAGPEPTSLRFEVGPEPTCLVTGDFNGDGRADLAAATADSHDIAVPLGNGDGTFQAPVRVGAGADPWSLVTADFNGDGRPDLAGNFLDDETAVLLGNGDGTFQAPVRVGAGWAEPTCLVTGDFNGDHRPDLAAGIGGSNSIAVLLGGGDKRFAPAALSTTPHATPVVADLNGDGTDDVLVINAAGDILWRKGRPQERGTFHPPITINPGHPSRDIVAVDTHQGPVLASVDATDPRQPNRLSINTI